MIHHPIITGLLLGVAVALALVCSIGVLVMRDAFQRMHFCSPVVCISSFLIAAAVWVEDDDPQSRIKSLLIAVLLLVMNSLLTHATAKAVRIHGRGHWPPRPEEQIPIVGRDEIAGAIRDISNEQT